MPLFQSDVSLAPNDYNRYCIINNDELYLSFDYEEPLKLHFLNAIHSDMSIGSDGFIETDVNGPDILFRRNHIPTKNILNKFKLCLKTIPHLYKLEESEIYEKNSRKIKMFGKQINAKYKCTQSNYLSVTDNNLPICKGFAFPYLDGKVSMKSPKQITFAILNYDDASTLIQKSKIHKNQYNTFLDLKALDKVEFTIYNIGDKGIICTEYNKEECNLHINKKLKQESDSCSPIWKRVGTQIGIWKPTKTFQVEDLSLLKFILQKTYGNFCFQREVCKCFGLNVYTGEFIQLITETI